MFTATNRTQLDSSWSQPVMPNHYGYIVIPVNK